MRRALNLAKRGLGKVHPNPMVGAVLVRRGQVIGEGFHESFGGPHAEANAIQSAHDKATGSTLYVTLEPCAHYGKTPPCSNLIVRNNIKAVVVGATDPNPLVSGKGMRFLKKAGLQVKAGILNKECEALNNDFNFWMRKKMPYVIVKVAQSLDGKIATKTGESQWITSSVARIYSQRLRTECDAVLVGVNTVLRDDPLLSVRHRRNSPQPIKVILDSHLRISPKARIFSKDSKGPVILAVTHQASEKRRKLFQGKAVILDVKEKNGRVALRALLSELAKQGILRVMIEGGGEVIAEAFAEKLVQEVYVFIAPKIIGGREAINAVAGEGICHLKDALELKEMRFERIGRDLLICGRF